MADTTDTAASSRTAGGNSRPETDTDANGGGATSSTTSTRDRFGRLSSDVQDRYRRVSEDVRRGAERASSELRRGTEQAREKYQVASESLKEGYERARTEADDITRQVSTYVRENPGRSILMAAGVGFLLGLLFRGRDEEELE